MQDFIYGIAALNVVIAIIQVWRWIGKVAKEDLDEKGLRRGRAWDKDWKE